MGTIILYIIMSSNAIISLFYPWIGIFLAYIITVLTPHNIWWWVFQDVRPLYWVLVPTLAGFVLAILRGNVNFSGLNTKLNLCIGILWLSFTISYYFGPYVDVVNEYRFYDPGFMFSTLQKTYLTYLVGVLLINDARKLKILSTVIIVTVIYMTYWANAQYFIYNKFGRLGGPIALGGTSIYADENNFAVLFVVGFPFLFYFGYYLKNKILTWCVWAIIPFCWHAVFLTASRGALLGIVAVLLVFVVRLEKKGVALLIMAGFFAAFLWQAGDVMKSRSATISNYQEEDSAAKRLDAWEASTRMMLAYPFTGVGFASFGQAFPDFSDSIPRIAHNTFFQIGGEYGVLAAIVYLVLIFFTLNRLRIKGYLLRNMQMTNLRNFYYCLNEACLLGLTGFFVCSLFLSLEKYEVFYYLLILANGVSLFADADTGQIQDDCRGHSVRDN